MWPTSLPSRSLSWLGSWRWLYVRAAAKLGQNRRECHSRSRLICLSPTLVFDFVIRHTLPNPLLSPIGHAVAQLPRQPINPLIMFLAFVGLTLLITFWAAKRNTGASAYFAAGRSITGWQNGLAVAGDYMSAASFLGISGMICFSGYDGFMLLGRLSRCLHHGAARCGRTFAQRRQIHHGGSTGLPDETTRPVRALASLSTLVVSTFYMIAQMVGAGAVIDKH